jgi:protoporphyrinogen oxidase
MHPHSQPSTAASHLHLIVQWAGATRVARCAEDLLKLAQRQWTPSVVYHQGELYPFDSPQGWITFPGFSWLDVARFGALGAFFKALPNGVHLERYTADAWLQRWLGRRAYDSVWRPMLAGKFGERCYRDVNLAWMWARQIAHHAPRQFCRRLLPL